jgi:hypothetical protein
MPDSEHIAFENVTGPIGLELARELAEDRALWFDLMLTSEDRKWMEQIEAGFREVAV